MSRRLGLQAISQTIEARDRVPNESGRFATALSTALPALSNDAATESLAFLLNTERIARQLT